jgi:hypothetical protein
MGPESRVAFCAAAAPTITTKPIIAKAFFIGYESTIRVLSNSL